jgi:hypothetical protein
MIVMWMIIKYISVRLEVNLVLCYFIYIEVNNKIYEG